MITSIQNNQVKKWHKLKTRKERIKTGCFLVEGFHLIEEAWHSNWKIEEIIVQEGVEVPTWSKEIRVVTVTESVFKHLAQTKNPQGVLAVVAMKETSSYEGNNVLLVDRIQDPGNLGTIIRTADAAGFSAVILGDGTVDLYNDKVIRATQGSLFHISIMEANLLDQMDKLKKAGFSIWAAALEDSIDYKELKVQGKLALIVGNEGAGIQNEIIQKADHIVKIPIYGKAESLNVSIAAGILMYYMKS